jgi:hypothetical protein
MPRLCSTNGFTGFDLRQEIGSYSLTSHIWQHPYLLTSNIRANIYQSTSYMPTNLVTKPPVKFIDNIWLRLTAISHKLEVIF